MATYTNLASLSGLAVGDEITYTTATAIDTASYKVRVKLYGKRESYQRSQTGSGFDVYCKNGGIAQFDFDTDIGSDYFHLYWTPDYGSSLMLDPTQSSTTRTAYYRIAVAGNAGGGGKGSSGTCAGGAGGGSTAGNGTDNSGVSGNNDYGRGATQTSGGSGGSVSGYGYYQGNTGYFGYGGSSVLSSGYYAGSGAGGAGWYYGGSGGGHESYGTGGGGGGSGFIVGQSTTTYPTGYLGNYYSAAIFPVTSAISNATLTQGTISIYNENTGITSLAGDGSHEDSPKMVLTVLALPVPKLESIYIDSTPTKTVYYVGDTFDPTGLVVKGLYSDSSTATLPSTDYTLSIPDMTTPGTKTITVTYSDSSMTSTDSFDILVKPNLDYISIVSNPTKTQYFVGETFNSSGLVVSATYTNNTSATITTYTLSSPDMSTAGLKTITVTYTENSITRTTTFNINVSTPVLSSIAVATMPTKTQYYTGDTFDPTGLVLTATLTDSSTQTVSSGYVCTSPDMSTAGTKNVSVSYTLDGVTASTTFQITVSLPPYGIKYYTESGTTTAPVQFTTSCSDPSLTTITTTSSDARFQIVIDDSTAFRVHFEPSAAGTYTAGFTASMLKNGVAESDPIPDVSILDNTTHTYIVRDANPSGSITDNVFTGSYTFTLDSSVIGHDIAIIDSFSVSDDYTWTIDSTITVPEETITAYDFVPCDVYYYNGNAFVKCEVYYYDNGSFHDIRL